MRIIFLFLFAVASLPLNCFSQETPARSFSIDGFVYDNINEGISDVTLTLDGTARATAVTNGIGYYRFENLAPGDYTITPARQGYIFHGKNRHYSQLSDNFKNQNFIGSTNLIIYEVETNEVDDNWASVTWKTNFPSSSKVEYGATADYGKSSSLIQGLVYEHYMKLYSLTPGTTYHYRVISSTSTDATSFYSTDYEFVELKKQRLFDKIAAHCYPNACSVGTYFFYDLFEPVDSVTISVYSLSGEKVAELASKSLAKGANKFFWDLKDDSGNMLPLNLYSYVIKVKKGLIEEKVRKMGLSIIKKVH